MSGGAEGKKEALLAGLGAVRRQILETAAALSPAQREQVFLGTWTIRELLAHLIGWDHANMEAAQAIRDGRLPDFYAYHDRDWRSYNALLVERHGREDFGELVTAVRASQHDLLCLAQAIPAGEFNKDHGVRFRGYKVTIGRLLQAELEDERVHLGQIEQFADS